MPSCKTLFAFLVSSNVDPAIYDFRYLFLHLLFYASIISYCDTEKFKLHLLFEITSLSITSLHLRGFSGVAAILCKYASFARQRFLVFLSFMLLSRTNFIISLYCRALGLISFLSDTFYRTGVLKHLFFYQINDR